MKTVTTFIFLISLAAYTSAATPDSILTKEEALRRQQLDEPYWQFSAMSGFSYRLAALPEDMSSFEKEYYSDLKSGYFYEFSIARYLKSGVGFGVFYEAFKSKNELKNVTVTFGNGFAGTGTVSDDITISFFGPMLTYRRFNKNHNAFFIAGISIGPMSYENHEVIITPYTITGRTVGFGWSAAYYAGLSREIWLGIHAAYYSGILTNYDIDDGSLKKNYKLPENQYEGLQHLSLGVTACLAL